MGQAHARHAWKQISASEAVLAEVWRVKEGLRCAADLLQFPGQEGARVTGHGGGSPPAVRAVLSWTVSAGPTDAAEKAFDLLDGFTEHCLPQEDIYPWVQDGVHSCDADGLQIGIFADFSY